MLVRRVIAGSVLVLAAVLVVLCLAAARELERERAVRLRSPAFDLIDGASGVWAPDWSAWSLNKGAPLLRIEGVPDRSLDRPEVTVTLRFDPTDASEPLEGTAAAEPGAIEAPCELRTLQAQLDGTRARSIAYEVRSPHPGWNAGRACLALEGADDHLLWHVEFGAQASAVRCGVGLGLPALAVLLHSIVAGRRRNRAAKAG